LASKPILVNLLLLLYPMTSSNTPSNTPSSSWLSNLAATVTATVSEASIRANELRAKATEQANSEDTKRIIEQAKNRMDDWGKGVTKGVKGVRETVEKGE
jgi:hypothetical protein